MVDESIRIITDELEERYHGRTVHFVRQSILLGSNLEWIDPPYAVVIHGEWTKEELLEITDVLPDEVNEKMVEE